MRDPKESDPRLAGERDATNGIHGDYSGDRSGHKSPPESERADRDALSGAIRAHRDAIEKVLVPLAANGIRHDIKAHANRYERVAEWRRVYSDLVNGPAADGDGAAAMRAAIARAVPTGELAPDREGVSRDQ